MNAVERIEATANLLDKYDSLLSQCIKEGGQQEDLPAIAFERAFEFGRSTLRSAALVLGRRRDYRSAITLVRGFYELAMRMLWASREPSGWQRFQVYYVKQDKVWAEEAKTHDQWQGVAERLSELADSVLDRTDARGQPYEPMPKSLEQVLRGNEDRDIKDGYAEELGAARYQYTHVYRMMCRPAHGNVFPLTEEFPAPDLRHLVLGAGYAVFALLRAACTVHAKDMQMERADTEILTRQVREIIAGSEHLSLEDLQEPETE